MIQQQAALRADRDTREKWWEHKIYWLVKIILLINVAYFFKGLYYNCSELFDYYMEYHSLHMPLITLIIIKVLFCYILIKQFVIRMVRD